MIKKFKKFRDKLTYKQVVNIMIVVDIIIAIVFAVFFILPELWNSQENQIQFSMAVFTRFLSLLCFEFGIPGLIWLLLDGFNKESMHYSEQTNSRLMQCEEQLRKKD